MLGRLLYYQSKFRQRWHQGGWSAAAREAGSFLRRRRFFAGFVWEAWEYQLSSRFRRLETTIREVRELRPLSKRLMVYVSFDRESIVRPHVVEQLRYFHGVGYSIAFVTTSPELPEREAAKLTPFLSRLLHRQNIGYDFSSYRAGFDQLRAFALDAESLIMMNDSCFGPSFEFSARLAEMRADVGSVWGITKSYEITEYIQSYFFHFGSELLRGGTVGRYFDRVRILDQKRAIVRYYEIGGSRWLRQWGIPLKALVDPAVPDIASLMVEHGLTDPTRDPVARLLEEQKLLPLRKRSLGPSTVS